MAVEPDYGPVGELFKSTLVFRVPPYQRSYSWEQTEIEDFLRDLKVCYKKRKYETETIHFFGQIVCLREPLQGTDDLFSYHLVDGQQRIATFVLLAAALIKIYNTIYADIKNDLTLNNEKGVLEGRIKDLSREYLFFKKEIQGSRQPVDVLELSNVDKLFFKNFLRDDQAIPEMPSHICIKKAYELIYEKVNGLTNSTSLEDRIGNLKMIEHILKSDFRMLTMVADDRKIGYKLFQVLNNRGKNLTEADLLRAESLRLLEGHQAAQRTVETEWDDILKSPPQVTELFLRAIYGSHKGEKAGAGSLFTDFLNHFIPENEYETISAEQAAEIQGKIESIGKDIITLRKIINGDWPYEHQSPVEYWDRNRLYMLIHVLKHTECLPFLLSARTLNHREFNKIVQTLERFVFRYVIICNQYIGDLITLYHEEAKVIRDTGRGYTVANLIAKLRPLELSAGEPMFLRMLDELKYHPTGKSNKPLKYFLLSIEYYYRWYQGNAAGTPECHDKACVFDFEDSTLEHVYARNAPPTMIIDELEPLKNTLGNVIILGNQDNRLVDTSDFATKKEIIALSSLITNREMVAVQTDWTKEVVEARAEDLKRMAAKIFRL